MTLCVTGSAVDTSLRLPDAGTELPVIQVAGQSRNPSHLAFDATQSTVQACGSDVARHRRALVSKLLDPKSTQDRACGHGRDPRPGDAACDGVWGAGRTFVSDPRRDILRRGLTGCRASG